MSANLPSSGKQVHSTLDADGTLRLSLAQVPVAQPGEGEVVIAVEAAPINPSDMMTLLASADPARADFADGAVIARIDADAARQRAGRFGQPLAVGLECAGTVIAAGKDAEGLIGRKVAALSLTRGAFGQYLTVGMHDCAPLPDDVSTSEGAGMFCNPLTALAMAETVRLEGHAAMIHTAAASNLGQMLVRICKEDGIALVNVVRRAEHVELLKGIGASHVVNSSLPSFPEDLRAAIAETGARIAFDAIGGGSMVDELHRAMEDAAVARMAFYSPYGSPELKQVYIYGRLDTSPTVINTGDYGMLWDVRHWYMGATLERVGPERAVAMQQRVLSGLKTTFASHFSHVIPLSGVLDRDTMLGYSRQATGEKYLIDPRL